MRPFFFFFTAMQTETDVQSQLVKLFQVEICSEKMTCKTSSAPRNHPRTRVLKCSKFRVCFGKRQNKMVSSERESDDGGKDVRTQHDRPEEHFSEWCFTQKLITCFPP